MCSGAQEAKSRKEKTAPHKEASKSKTLLFAGSVSKKGEAKPALFSASAILSAHQRQQFGKGFRKLGQSRVQQLFS
jgi:hypothetical protein